MENLLIYGKPKKSQNFLKKMAASQGFLYFHGNPFFLNKISRKIELFKNFKICLKFYRNIILENNDILYVKPGKVIQFHR